MNKDLLWPTFWVAFGLAFGIADILRGETGFAIAWFLITGLNCFVIGMQVGRNMDRSR